MKTMKKMKEKQMKARNGLTAIGFMPLFVGVILWIGTLTSAYTQVITIGGPANESAESIIQTTDGGYAVAGKTNSFGAGNDDVYVVKLDGSGNIRWTRTIGGRGYDDGSSIIQTTDGGYAVAGSTKSYGTGGFDIYVVMLDGYGNMSSCPGGCQVSSGGTAGSGGKVSSGGTAGSGGTLTKICP
jgi:hypothetical protein